MRLTQVYQVVGKKGCPLLLVFLVTQRPSP